MLRVGVTGGIGSGKTALTDWLATQGVTIVDADLAARSVVRPGQPALLEIADEFGKEYLDSEGELDRAALRALVFNDEAKRNVTCTINQHGVMHSCARFTRVRISCVQHLKSTAHVKSVLTQVVYMVILAALLVIVQQHKLIML